MFSGGTGSIDNGVGTVTSGTPVTVKPSATTTYTLTVNGGANGTVTSTVTVAFGVEGAAISLSADNIVPAIGQSITVTATVTPAGATGSVGFGIDSTNIVQTVPLDANSTAQLTQTFKTPGSHQVFAYYIDSAGSFGGNTGGVKNVITIAVGATGPVITSFGANPASIAPGGSAQLTATFGGGDGQHRYRLVPSRGIAQ